MDIDKLRKDAAEMIDAAVVKVGRCGKIKKETTARVDCVITEVLKMKKQQLQVVKLKPQKLKS